MALRWGIIGTADIAGRGMAPALKQAADTELLAVCSRSLDKARAFAAKHGIGKSYDSLERMLSDPELDAVYVATPNSLHAAHTILAAQAGKHVLCEKPMAITVGDAEAMLEACARHKVKLGVVFQNRYHQAHAEARRLVQTGTFGEIQLASAQMLRGYARGGRWSGWRLDPNMAGCGAIVAQAVHPIDLLRYLLGSEVESVQAMTDEAPPERPVEEMVYSVIRFGNGVHATVIAGMLVPRYDNDLLLYGSSAKLACRGTLGVPRANTLQELTLESDSSITKMPFGTNENSMPAKMARLVEDFHRAIAEDTEPGVSGCNGLQMVKIATAMLESSRQGKAVTITG